MMVSMVKRLGFGFGQVGGLDGSIYMVLPCMDPLVYCPLAEADGVSETLLQEFARHDVNALWETVPWQHRKDFTMI